VDPSFIPVTDVDVGDFNGDAIQDLVAAVPHNGSRTAILIGNGDGTFRAPLVLTSPHLNLPQQQAVADYNGDGFQDLALSLGDGSFGLMQIRNGNGDGTFQAAVHYLQPPPTSSVGGIFIASAHLNGDTKPDIVLNIGGAFPSFAVLLNSTGAGPPPTPAAPTLLSPAQDATPAQPVAFDWTDVAAASAYRIQIDDSNNFSAPLVADRVVTPSQFTAGTLNAGRQHWWRVRGINSAGTAGAWSSVRRFTAGAFTQAPSLAGIAVNPTSVVGGNTSEGTASLTSAAPSGGAVVTLSSSNTGAATVPASITVPAGALSATFTVSTASVTATTSLTINGAFGGTTRSATLTVTPPSEPPPPAQTATLTVTATGRGGERVTSSPAGINVAVGTTGSASFAVGATVTLRATNERDVIWSGACSSGGNKTKTCTFTLNANAAVTANVQ
jgi:FG-GAP-like repeat